MVGQVKMILLVQFLQLLIQAHDLLVLNHFETNLSFQFLGFVNEQPPSFYFCKDTSFVLFFQMMNVLIFNMYRLSYVYDLLLGQDLGDWVKARSTTWYVHFLMTQYDNKR